MANGELWKLPAYEAVELLRCREITPLDLVEACHARWQATDAAVNSMPITCWEEARADAQRLAADGFPDPPPRGYLYGLPVAVKDATAVKGLRFTMGSKLWEHRVATEDDPMIVRLRERGATIIGKTNTPELTGGSHTYNAVFGITRNPWNLALSAGGSSGGSAVALAVGSCSLATGSDFGGSLRNPAGWNGVVGFRTTPELVPQANPMAVAGPLPWPSARPRAASVSGPMGRCVRDVALMLDALTVSSDSDSYEAAVVAATAAPPRWRVAFSPDLGGLVPTDPGVAAACRAAANWFASDPSGSSGSGGAGGSDKPAALPEECPDFSRAPEMWSTLRCTTAAPLAELEMIPGWRDIVKPEIVWQVEQIKALMPEIVASAEAAHDALTASRDAFFRKYDLLACPVAIMPPFPVELTWPREFRGIKFNNYVEWILVAGAISLLGVPAISVPCGFTPDGLPVGLSLVGPPGSEARVLAAAAAYEAAHGWSKLVPRDPAGQGAGEGGEV